MGRRVLGAFLVPLLSLPGSVSALEVDDTTLAREVEAYLKGLVEADEFSGAVILRK
jgi:hypothetical protein